MTNYPKWRITDIFFHINSMKYASSLSIWQQEKLLDLPAGRAAAATAVAIIYNKASSHDKEQSKTSNKKTQKPETKEASFGYLCSRRDF
jgi:hypothetical protein